MMASFSSSESTAPEGSRSSGSGALASIAAPGESVSGLEVWRGERERWLTLLLGLVLLLVLCEEHVVGQTAAGHCALQAHRVRLARQAARAEAAVGKRHTALPLHVDGALELGAFGLGLVFLLLLGARLLCIAVKLALLALLRARLEALDGRLACPDVAVVVLALLFPQSRLLGLLGLLLLPLLVCFLVQAVADVCRRGRAQDGPAAVLALDRVDLVVQGAACRESSERLLVERVDDRRARCGRLAVGICCRVRLCCSPIAARVGSAGTYSLPRSLSSFQLPSAWAPPF